MDIRFPFWIESRPYLVIDAETGVTLALFVNERLAVEFYEKKDNAMRPLVIQALEDYMIEHGFDPYQVKQD